MPPLTYVFAEHSTRHVLERRDSNRHQSRVCDDFTLAQSTTATVYFPRHKGRVSLPVAALGHAKGPRVAQNPVPCRKARRSVGPGVTITESGVRQPA